MLSAFGEQTSPDPLRILRPTSCGTFYYCSTLFIFPFWTTASTDPYCQYKTHQARFLSHAHQTRFMQSFFDQGWQMQDCKVVKLSSVMTLKKTKTGLHIAGCWAAISTNYRLLHQTTSVPTVTRIGKYPGHFHSTQIMLQTRNTGLRGTSPSILHKELLC